MGRSLSEYAGLSLWHADPRLDWSPRQSLHGDLEADVAIVGAGFTGLWTAHYLAEADPTLRIVVLEAEVAGYGASGRNGGWCSALFPASQDKLARLPGSSPAAALAQHREMCATVDEVGRVADRLGVPFAKGGTVVLARTGPQWRRARAEVAHARSQGRDDLVLLDEAATAARLRATRVRGATYTPDCAAIHPALLVRRLADDVERRGVRVLEHSPVLRIEPGRAVTAAGTVRAEVVVRATEGYTPGLAGQRRAVVPVYSLVLATEPLPRATWDEIGLARRETFSDHRHLIIYGQRTDDDRLVFGGRGAPYHLGSRIRPEFDRDPRVFAKLRETLVDLFPAVGRRPDRPRLGRGARHPPRLVRVGGAGPRDRPRLGGRVRRRRRRHHQPGRPDPARPRARPRHRARAAPVGGAPLPAVGARAVALAGHQRRAAGDDARRRRGAGDPPAQPRGPGDGAVRRRLAQEPFSPGRWPRCRRA